MSKPDYDRLMENWKQLYKWNSLYNNASDLFKDYISFDSEGKDSILNAMQDIISIIEDGNIWSGNAADAVTSKIQELMTEQRTVDRNLAAIREKMMDRCTQNSNKWQKIVIDGERNLDTLETAHLNSLKKKYQSNH